MAEAQRAAGELRNATIKEETLQRHSLQPAREKQEINIIQLWIMERLPVDEKHSSSAIDNHS